MVVLGGQRQKKFVERWRLGGVEGTSYGCVRLQILEKWDGTVPHLMPVLVFGSRI